MANVSFVQSWQAEVEAVSGAQFPNTTEVRALDAYGSVVSTASDTVTADEIEQALSEALSAREAE